MQYVASNNRITFHHNGITTTIRRKDNAYFDRVMDGIKNGVDPSQALPCYITNPEAVSEMTGGQIYYRDGQFQSDAFPFPRGLSYLLKELLDKDLPVMPLINLSQKLSYLEGDLPAQVGDFVAEGQIPLSWDGNLITYARSSWVAGNYEVRDWMERGFVPHETRTGNLTTGTFSWVTRQCPDQGRVFDLLVQPQHITQVDNNIIRCSQLTNISTLQETQSQENRVQLIETETNPLGEKLYVRSPFSQAQISHYIASSVGKRTAVPEPATVAL